MTINAMHSSVLSTYVDLGDPVAMADVAVMQMADDERKAGTAERHDAEQTREHELDAQSSAQRASAITHLVTGLAQGATQFGQAACSFQRAGVEANAASRADRQIDADPDPEVEAENRRDDIADRASLARLDASGQMFQGAEKLAGAGGEMIASEFDQAARAHERTADRARSRIDDARSSVQHADSMSERVLGRMGETLQTVAQSRLALVNALRA